MITIMLHGMAQTAASWDDTVRYLEDREHVFCPNLYQYLDENDARYRKLYRPLAERLEEIGEPLHLCGHSLGGVFALHYAAEHPAQVRSLAVIATQYKTNATLLNFQNLVYRFMPEEPFRTMGLEKQTFLSLSRSLATVDLRNDLGKIECPVLVVCGDRDKINRRASEELNDRLPHAKLLIVDNAGVEVNLDAPRALGERLRDFFRSTQS